MPATLTAVRSGLKTRLATIIGLRCYDVVPAKPELPAAIVQGPELIDFDFTMARGADRHEIPILVIVSQASDRAAQASLDGYIAGAGAGSVKAAIEADRTLGGVAHSCRVMRARNYGFVEVGETTYLGVQFIVEVIA